MYSVQEMQDKCNLISSSLISYLSLFRRVKEGVIDNSVTEVIAEM